jgi:hypothetical protein
MGRGLRIAGLATRNEFLHRSESQWSSLRISLAKEPYLVPPRQGGTLMAAPPPN